MKIRKAIVITVFIFLCGRSVHAGLFYGFGIGYTAKNVYKDRLGMEEEEANIPLLGLSGGYRLQASAVDFILDGHADFFATDVFRGNREYVVFADPQGFISVPLRIGELGFSPIVGYGGIQRIRYIKEQTYLSAEERYVNAADFSEGIFDILYGAQLLYSDWFSSSFIITKDIESLYTFSCRIRTPHCRGSIPFISFTYREGEKIRTFGLGLAFYR
jgi:hypothetical protein